MLCLFKYEFDINVYKIFNISFFANMTRAGKLVGIIIVKPKKDFIFHIINLIKASKYRTVNRALSSLNRGSFKLHLQSL